MVSQHDLCGRSQLFDVSENLKRVRSPIHQVANKPQSVRCGIKVNAIDELIQLRGATLHIADGIGGHGQAVGWLISNRAGERFTGIALQSHF